MCYTLPGPRCSNHARQQLASAFNAERKAETEVMELQWQKKFTSEMVSDYPDNSTIAKRYARISSACEKAEKKRKVLKERLEQAQKTYDTTPAGQETLQALIDAEKKKPLSKRNVAHYNQLIARQKSGQLKRSWSMRAYKRAQDDKQGNTLRKQRGEFITFKDRDDSNQEIVHEKELIK